jgi:signal transduction histidine kinase
VTADLLTDPRIVYPPDMRARIEAADHRAGLAVPLVIQDQVIGALFVGALPGRAFPESDVRLVTTFADQAAVAIANANLYRDAEQANRTKDQFLAMLSHELRQPLNTMVGWVRMLRTGQATGPQQQRALDAIDRSTRAQARMIDDLLDIARIEAGKLTLERRPLAVGQLVAETVDSFQHEAKAKGVALDAEWPSTADLVSGDPDRLRQVLGNLIVNAIKYTPAGGRIGVRLAADGPVVRISVTDTGVGIEPELLPHVFERFRQAEWRAAETRDGLGLGLAIVRQIVEMHGGTAEASSDGPGRGATFTITLPR